jgi:hypothetical protein
MLDSTRPSWCTVRLVIAVFLVFFAGALVGVLAMRVGTHPTTEPSSAYYTIDGRKVSVEQLAKQLELSPTQAQQLETILDDFVMYVQMLQSQMDDVRANGKARILSILDEKQRTKFERMLGDLQQAKR